MTILNIVLAFLAAHWLDIIVLAVIVIAAAWLIKHGKKKMVIRIVYALVAKAEQKYGSKTGPIKWTDVWSEIYAHIPWYLRMLFTESEFETYIDKGWKWLTKLLKDNPDMNLLTYAQELLNGKTAEDAAKAAGEEKE